MTEATDPILAFDIGGTKIAAAIVAEGRCLQRAQRATPRSGRGADIVEAMASLAASLPPSAAVGVATTGIVRAGTLTAVNPTTLPIEDGFPLAAALAARLGRDPLVINDGQAAAWAEFRHGAGKATEAMAFITVSTGIGGAFVIGGALRIGARGLAGHVGHVVVDPEGPVCGCGRRGCIERLASGTAIAAIASEQFGRPVTAPEVFEAAAAGDAGAAAILETASRYLARVITDCVALLDLDCVVIGGGVGLAAGFLDRVISHADSEPELFRRPIRAARLGPDAGLIGVADMVATSVA